ncbi:RmlC-like cupin [Lentithecium fluviatile CBS 122367]|uniref:RmlC-like cupin n=1 Tax=Lentithecium fluviatile CBS 122367 TaxID=1168545 RepID=A0A6G1JKR3_9PLEO|nr:RmlC-like cupin [Lentithecium fluviatile CBS 122367]
MRFLPLLPSLLGLVIPSSALRHRDNDNSSLIVTTVPDYIRPYVVHAYTLDGVRLGAQVYRFPVTGPSSGNAFTLISTASPSSTDLGVLPHAHLLHYENFYCLRGRYALWTSKDNLTNGRILTPGDYGAVPHNTTHTFQLLDPFTEMVGVIQPGGFEDLFYFLASANYSSTTYAPFPQGNFTSPGGDAETIAKLEAFDVHARLTFSPPFDFGTNAAVVEGNSENETTIWHDGENELAADSETPFYIAKGYGPKYLATLGSSNTSYAIVEPFITATQSSGNFTEGTITLSQIPAGAEPESYVFSGHTALEVVDGLVGVSVGGFEEMTVLAVGDVVFVPSGRKWSFWGEAAYSKVLYVGQGEEGLASRLVGGATRWESVVWPEA